MSRIGEDDFIPIGKKGKPKRQRLSTSSITSPDGAEVCELRVKTTTRITILTDESFKPRNISDNSPKTWKSSLHSAKEIDQETALNLRQPNLHLDKKIARVENVQNTESLSGTSYSNPHESKKGTSVGKSRDTVLAAPTESDSVEAIDELNKEMRWIYTKYPNDIQLQENYLKKVTICSALRTEKLFLTQQVNSLKSELESTRNELQREKETVLSEKAVLESRNDMLRGRVMAQLMKLAGRGSVDHVEANLCPIWLQSSAIFTRSQKWVMALTHRMTPLADAIATTLELQKISFQYAATTVENLYESWGRERHRERMDPIESDAGWKMFFHELNVNASPQQDVLRSVLTYYDAEKSNKPQHSNISGPFPGYICLRNIKYSASVEDLEKFFSENNVVTVNMIHLVTSKVPPKPTGIYSFFVNDVNQARLVYAGLPEDLIGPNKRVEFVECHLCSEK